MIAERSKLRIQSMHVGIDGATEDGNAWDGGLWNGDEDYKSSNSHQFAIEDSSDDEFSDQGLEGVHSDSSVELESREEVARRIEARFRQCLGLLPKVTQLNVLLSLEYDKKDVILIATTGFGKSAIFHVAPMLKAKTGLALIIMPLKALQSSQMSKVSKISGARPFVLNGETNTPLNRRMIAGGFYTHGKSKRYP